MDSEDSQHLRAFVENRTHEAFSALVEAHANLVSRIAHKRIPADSVADVVQEVFCKLATKAPSLTNHPSVAGWLVRVTVLECSKFHRREANRMKRESVHAQEQTAGVELPAYTEEDFLAVEEALAGLPSVQRDAIMLRFYERVPFRLIGQRVGKSEAAAQKLVSRAVERLRGQLSRNRPGITTSAAAFTAALASIFVSTPIKSEAAQSIAVAALQTSSSSAPFLSAFYIMTTTHLKIATAAGLAAFLPIVYLWHTKDTVGENTFEAPAIETKNGQAPLNQKGLPPAPRPGDAIAQMQSSSLSQVASNPIDWKQRRYQEIIDDLSHEEWKIRRGAAEVLKNEEVPPEMAVPALTNTLGDEEWQVRKSVAEALATYGEDAIEAVPQLVHALDDEEWHVRKPVAEALGVVGPSAAEAAPKLIQVLGDEEWQVRNSAAMALISIPSSEAVPALTKALSDEEWHVAANASMALANIGSEAEASVVGLISALDHEEWHVRNNAAHALGLIGDTRAINRLTASLNDDEEQVRETAAKALGHFQETK